MTYAEPSTIIHWHVHFGRRKDERCLGGATTRSEAVLIWVGHPGAYLMQSTIPTPCDPQERGPRDAA